MQVATAPLDIANKQHHRANRRRWFAGALLLGVASGMAGAQTVAAVALPDSPGFSESTAMTPTFPASMLTPDAGSGTASKAATPHEAGEFDKVIEPGDTAAKLTVFDKSLLGMRHSISAFSAAGWVLVAGYEQVTNGSPNYGQTGKGFAQRLGAAAARDFSEGVFSDAIVAPILHQDPRYYRMGPRHNVLKRFVYAGTRTIFTRTDGGVQTVNFSLLGGNVAGAALTQAYYPPINRGFGEVAKTFATSIGGAAFGFEFDEFFLDAFRDRLHRTP
jgi:hypothetical protein